MSDKRRMLFSSLITHHCFSVCKGIDDYVDAEARVIAGEKALVAPVVVPFAAVVFVRVEHSYAVVNLYGLKILVHHVVAPDVQLVRSGWRPGPGLGERIIEQV